MHAYFHRTELSAVVTPRSLNLKLLGLQGRRDRCTRIKSIFTGLIILRGIRTWPGWPEMTQEARSPCSAQNMSRDVFPAVYPVRPFVNGQTYPKHDIFKRAT